MQLDVSEFLIPMAVLNILCAWFAFSRLRRTANEGSQRLQVAFCLMSAALVMLPFSLSWHPVVWASGVVWIFGLRLYGIQSRIHLFTHHSVFVVRVLILLPVVVFLGACPAGDRLGVLLFFSITGIMTWVLGDVREPAKPRFPSPESSVVWRCLGGVLFLAGVLQFLLWKEIPFALQMIGGMTGISSVLLLMTFQVYRVNPVAEDETACSPPRENAAGEVTEDAAEGSGVEADEEIQVTESGIDTLTNIMGRKRFLEHCGQVMPFMRRHQMPCTLMVFDIDGFSGINDQFGWETGDRVLRILADVVRDAMREEDVVARYSATKFVALMPATPPDEAILVAERIRQLVTMVPMFQNGQSFHMTCTFGLSTMRDKDVFTEMYHRAAYAMKEGKHKGKNCVVHENDIH